MAGFFQSVDEASAAKPAKPGGDILKKNPAIREVVLKTMVNFRAVFMKAMKTMKTMKNGCFLNFYENDEVDVPLYIKYQSISVHQNSL